MKNECWLCGKEHSGDCRLDDEYWKEQERRNAEHEALNICNLCGKFSKKSVLHSECADQESYLMSLANAEN